MRSFGSSAPSWLTRRRLALMVIVALAAVAWSYFPTRDMITLLLFGWLILLPTCLILAVLVMIFFPD